MLRTHADIQPVETRLATLERQHRRLRCASIAVATVGALALLAPYSARVRRVLPNGRTVEAQALTLLDADGRPRAALRVMPDGTPSLTLNDKDAKTRVSLVVNADNEARLDLADKNERTRVALSVIPDGVPFLEFVDQRDALRAGLMLGAEGEPAFILMDKGSHGRAALGVKPDGSPRLCLVENEHEHCRGIHSAASGAFERPAADDEPDTGEGLLPDRTDVSEFSATTRLEH